MKRGLGFLGVVAALVAIGVWVVLGRPIDSVANLLLGGFFVGWGLVVLTWPWDLHFQAAHVLRELDASHHRGLDPETDRRQLVRIVRRTRLIAIAGHLVSAAAIAAFAWWSAWPAAGWVALGLAVSTIFRPMGAWYTHLRARLRRALKEVRLPREDAVELRHRIEVLEARASQLLEHKERAEEAVEQLTEQLNRTSAHHERRLEQVGRRFERSLEELTDNQELLAGIRAFLKMVRAAPS